LNPFFFIHVFPGLGTIKVTKLILLLSGRGPASLYTSERNAPEINSLSEMGIKCLLQLNDRNVRWCSRPKTYNKYNVLKRRLISVVSVNQKEYRGSVFSIAYENDRTNWCSVGNRPNMVFESNYGCTVIRVFLSDPNTGVLSQGGKELIAEWRASDSLQIWVDIEGESNEVDQDILSGFGIHPLAIQDALRPRHPPKIERFDNFLFILLRGLNAKTSGINVGFIQLSLFVGDRFLLTRHSSPSMSINWMCEEVQRDAGVMKEGPGSLAIHLSNRLARRYVEILIGLEPRLDEIEEQMFKKPDDKLLAELTSYKSQLRKLTRVANYHKQIAIRLRDVNDSFIGTELTHEIIDLYEQIERTESLAQLHYQISSDLTDGYLGMSSHQLNRVMQLLTIFTVIFVPLTFLAGIYGMNFENMPELSSRNGYFAVVGVMVIIAVTQLYYFRRKRWI
jgi:magnesium transporter